MAGLGEILSEDKLRPPPPRFARSQGDNLTSIHAII